MQKITGLLDMYDYEDYLDLRLCGRLYETVDM